jgi:hypothetical protein
MQNYVIDKGSARNGAEETANGTILRVGYADPPYLGQAKRHYSHDPMCAEVNHQVLIEHLNSTYDGWALSCSSPSLRTLLPLCPSDVRVGTWVKPFAAFKKANPAFAWEPVIFKPCRSRKGKFIVRDWVDANITLKRGVKPDRCSRFWPSSRKMCLTICSQDQELSATLGNAGATARSSVAPRANPMAFTSRQRFRRSVNSVS